jgi:hypothetical protein
LYVLLFAPSSFVPLSVFLHSPLLKLSFILFYSFSLSSSGRELYLRRILERARDPSIFATEFSIDTMTLIFSSC